MGRSDEIDVAAYGTDKFEAGYLPRYDREFEPYLGRPITLLEVGVLRGSSLSLWSDYFPEATIVGVDRNPLDAGFELPDRCAFAQGDQTDRGFLDRVAAEHAPDGFDIVIDDASHLGRESKITFEHTFEHHLRAGGTYLLEDWGTGYWPTWPDGEAVSEGRARRADALRNRLRTIKGGGRPSWRLPFPSHQQGMVGVVKQIVDAAGAPDQRRLDLPTAVVERVVISHGLAFVLKAATGSAPS